MNRQPKNWVLKTVADVCEMRNGHGFGPEDWDTVGLPIIRIQNLNGGQKFDYFPGEPDERWLVEPGQMLFSWAGTKGVSFGPTIWRGKRGVLNQHIFKVQPKANIDKEWLYWALKHVTNRIEAQSHGFKSTLVHVKKSDIDRQPISVPPAAEQRRIADILATWDQAIATAERLLDSSRQRKRGIARDLLLGRTRFKQFNAPWQQFTFRDVLKEVKRRVDWDDDRDYPLISVRRRSEGAFHRETLKGREILTKKLNYAYQSEFLISKMQVVHGAMAVVPKSLDGMFVSDSYLAFQSADEHRYDIAFIGYLSTTQQMYKAVRRCSYGVHIEKMTFDLDMFLKEKILMPAEIEEQRFICDVLASADRELAISKNHVEQLRQEKIALMSQLLTGVCRVG